MTYCKQDIHSQLLRLRAGTHYPHVTWIHVMLRLQLRCERRSNIEFCGADSHFCHSVMSCDLTWSSGGHLTCQHASHISVVAHISWGMTNVSCALVGFKFMTEFIVRRDAACS